MSEYPTVESVVGPSVSRDDVGAGEAGGTT